tara:strand:- start:118 stop:348 length:231 start_codon:yes stop_codon:yes gene_type:complete
MATTGTPVSQTHLKLNRIQRDGKRRTIRIRERFVQEIVGLNGTGQSITKRSRGMLSTTVIGLTARERFRLYFPVFE